MEDPLRPDNVHTVKALPPTSWHLTTVFLGGFSDSSVGKESACNAGDLGSIPGLGGFTGGGNSYSLQCTGLENPMEIGRAH